MITSILIRCMFAIAKMSKKVSAIYLSILTILFFGALSLVLYGAIYLTNGSESVPEYVVPILVVGFILFFFVLVMIALTTIASNYVRKNPDKEPQKESK